MTGDAPSRRNGELALRDGGAKLSARMTDARLERTLADTLELVSIRSPYGQERALCDRLEGRFARSGVHEILRADDSLCVLPRPLRPGHPRILLCGHLDTVPELSPNPPRRAGGRLFGLGSSDMKAAVALIAATVERAIERSPRFDVVAILYAREEGSFEDSAMPSILSCAGERASGSDLAVCMEPTDLRIELGCMGTAQVRLVFEGRRAHAARPWQGDNAIHKAGPLLCRLAERGRREVQVGGFTWYEVVSATTAAFRGAINVVPDRFELGLNLRFAPGRDRGEVEADLAALIAGEAQFAIESFWPSGSVVLGHPLVEQLRVAGGGLEVGPKQAWTDVGRFSQLGTPAINWGPGAKSQAHQEGEYVEERAIAAALTTLDRWLFAEEAR